MNAASQPGLFDTDSIVDKQQVVSARMSVSGFTTMAAVPIFVTILLAGIWHGAGATFVVFGLLHAIYLTINRACRIIRPNPPPPTRFGVVWRVVLTYSSVLLASIFFRAPSVSAALSMLTGMLGLHGLKGAAVATAGVATHLKAVAPTGPGLAALGPGSASRIINILGQVMPVVLLYVIVWAMPNTQQIFRDFRPALDEVTRPPIAWLTWRPNGRWALVMGGATALAALAIGGTSEFLYFQF